MCVCPLAGQKAALQYARQHFAKFATTHMADIQRVMGALCFARRAGTTPYADLSSPTQWDDVAREFARQCCGLLGQVKAFLYRCARPSSCYGFHSNILVF